MAVTETLQAHRATLVALTSSGARIEPINSGVARTFLERFGTQSELATSADGFWGAFEHSEALIAIGILVASASSAGRVSVTVVPERRGLGVGTELLQILVDEARARGLRTVACTHAASDPGPQRLVKSFGLTSARRVSDTQALTILVIPTADSPPC